MLRHHHGEESFRGTIDSANRCILLDWIRLFGGDALDGPYSSVFHHKWRPVSYAPLDDFSSRTRNKKKNDLLRKTIRSAGGSLSGSYWIVMLDLIYPSQRSGFTSEGSWFRSFVEWSDAEGGWIWICKLILRNLCQLSSLSTTSLVHDNPSVIPTNSAIVFRTLQLTLWTIEPYHVACQESDTLVQFPSYWSHIVCCRQKRRRLMSPNEIFLMPLTSTVLQRR